MAQVHPSAVVHKDAQLADGVTIGPNCVIAAGVLIDAGTVLDANVMIDKDVKIGQKNHFFASCVIGCQPQVLDMSSDAEIGGLVIGDDNIIHEQVTIHPSMHPGKLTRIATIVSLADIVRLRRGFGLAAWFCCISLSLSASGATLRDLLALIMMFHRFSLSVGIIRRGFEASINEV